ncbi:chymotrypsin-2-like [Trichogramma pretiosum]|uniref:chymotrypsin-2-like n=1 Tax=Trichogramma pretiosum TaxID=7493 RepID=UPI0006C9BBCA|nr:chymotrypsin-2-like [Trichogramma pretiosum]
MLKKSFLGLFVGLILNIAISNAKVVQRIVGGNYAPQGRFKHQVSLQMIGQDCTFHQCGGSIIDAIHIITAAHCVINDNQEFQNYNITIMAGMTDLRNKSSGIYRDVEYTIVPTSYQTSKGAVDDVAILRLKRPLPLKSESRRIRAINLPADDYRYMPPNTKLAIVSGFGSFKQNWNAQSGKIESGPLSPRLKFATGLINKIEPQFGCRDAEVCVLNDNSHGACHGDSGGPLIDPSTNTLIGIVSYSNHKWCGRTTKYTRVSSYLDFINKVRAGGLMDRNFISILHQNFDNEKIVGQLPYCT